MGPQNGGHFRQVVIRSCIRSLDMYNSILQAHNGVLGKGVGGPWRSQHM